MPKMEDWVFHIDANSFFAAVACQRRPELRPFPVAVTGDPSARRGIVLAANYLAKRKGVRTAETIGEAKAKCPGLICVGADSKQYERYSEHMKRRILADYSDRIESMGMDEAWTSVQVKNLQEAVRLADHIRERVKRELGITVSVGVADNKPFAKLASDYEKPDCTTVFGPESYGRVVWKMPAYELIYVGPARTKKLLKYNVLTIGDLANTDPDWIREKLGKPGLMLRTFARGEDRSPVMRLDETTPEENFRKSFGHSSTAPFDLETIQDIRCFFSILIESVTARMRKSGFRAKCINIAVRTRDMLWHQTQKTIKYPTASTVEIIKIAMDLFQEKRYDLIMPFHSLAIQGTQLSSIYAPFQLDIWGREDQLEKIENLENCVQGLRARFGHRIIQLGTSTLNPALAGINPHDDHRSPAAAYYYG